MAIKRPIERPIAGFVLSLLSGLFITAGGVYGLLNSGSYIYYGYSPYTLYSAVGVVLGTGLLLGAALLYLLPNHRVAWGIMVLVFGVSSLFSLLNPWAVLFFVGVPLALVGGSLAIAWKPTGVGGIEDYRTCLACGRHVLAVYPMCPFCGARAGEARVERSAPSGP